MEDVVVVVVVVPLPHRSLQGSPISINISRERKKKVTYQ
jgi:hypothetical protein